MSEDQAGSGSRPVVVSGPIHDRNELKKPTLVDEEIEGNDDHHPNNDTDKGNVTAVITDIQSEPVKAEKKNWVFYRRDGTILPNAPRLPPKIISILDVSDDDWCSGYDDVIGDEGCGFCGRGHIIERCRRYRRQRKLDAQCQARSSSTPLSIKD